ncbi:unnamed protein product [Rotaria sp. Silwood1]|nr:unnamed protein product [Rotaria sp. Silwood1]
MPTPGVIMRMISDPDSIPNIKTEKELLQGISDAATASGAWIITNGYKEESIVELVGEIVFKSRLKNTQMNFSAIAIGKSDNIQDCTQTDERFDMLIFGG